MKAAFGDMNLPSSCLGKDHRISGIPVSKYIVIN